MEQTPRRSKYSFKFKTIHSRYGLRRIEKGVKISLTTDTRPIESIPDFIKDSDLFICEAMYGDDLDISKAVRNKHMTFREAANLAKLGNVKQLLLTHFSPSLDIPSMYLENATNVLKILFLEKID